MGNPRAGRAGLVLGLMLPLLAGCHRPAAQADLSSPDNAAIRDAARQQEMQRAMDQNRYAGEALRAGMAAQAARSFPH